ncbi:MAG: ABC transporter transmembrane domain-containing protein, partial [Proteobacteria bacterium]|nr:ABC transporter transmembrane domain-containing protein [Pseudomonadota bacterium]
MTRLPIFLVVVATVKALALFYQWFTWEWIGEQVAKSWRFDVARCFVGIGNEARDDGLVKVQEEQLGGLIAQDIRILREFVVHYYGGLPREGLQVAFTGLGLFALSPKLFLIFVLCIAPVGALLSKYGRKIRKRSSRALNDNSQLSEWIQQRLLGLETIKHYGSETKESELMTSASSNLFERFRAAARLKSRTSPVIEAFGVVAMSIALAVAFQDIADHRLSGAVVMSFFSMLALFAQSAAKLGRYMNSNQDGEAAGERILMVLDQFQQHAERSDNLESSSEARLMNGSFLQTLIVRAPGDHTKI